MALPFVVVTALVTVVIPPLGAILAVVSAIILAYPASLRLHDIGRTGLWMVPVLAIPVMMLLVVIVVFGGSIFTLLIAAMIDPHVTDNDIAQFVKIVEVALGCVLGAWLFGCGVAMLWPGTKGANPFGPDTHLPVED